ncbi:hypothetical protein I79_025956 [Cricetulus griseus]|uniref:Uncharacterized protein n=1 Tax=Cricetulus griseus TaxID=10029 RepID=G3IPN8_CRIGR|nr:hypothetical protein I79_025956 [Cricetulus griseus]
MTGTQGGRKAQVLRTSIHLGVCGGRTGECLSSDLKRAPAGAARECASAASTWPRASGGGEDSLGDNSGFLPS